MAVPDTYMYTSALLAAETGKDWEYALHLLGSSPLPPFNAARYKLQKEKSKASEKKEGRPFHTEIERNITQLYKVETSSPITWVKVDP